MSIEALFQRNGMEWDVKENHLKHAIVFNLWYKKIQSCWFNSPRGTEKWGKPNCLAEY